MSSLTENKSTRAGDETSEKLRNAFTSHMDALDDSPLWWKEMKRDAFDRFADAPMPHRKNENWRFANISKMSIDKYAFGQPTTLTETQALVDRSNCVSNPSGQFIFADNQTIAAQKTSAELQSKGVIWTSLREALSKHGEILKDYFMKQDIDLGSEKFAHLHSAFLENGVLLYVPKGIEIEEPFFSSVWATGEGAAVYPHTLIIAEEFAKVKLVEVQRSAHDSTAFSCGVTHVFAGVGATVDYTLVQDLNEQTLGFQINSNVAGKDSNVSMNCVALGCEHYRSETHGQIRGSGANVEMFSLAVADRRQEIDQRTLQSHYAPSARSNLLFKNVLRDQARTIFSGLIKVEKDAQLTDAYQTNRNLLLSHTAEANSLPGLEIEADDVKCSHGATTSQVDDEEIFYMRARGISPAAAQELIVYGFCEEILERIEDPKLAAFAREAIQDKMRARKSS